MQPCSLQMEAELRAFLQALPTKSDMQLIIGCLEEKHCKEIQVVRKDVQSLSTRLTIVEASIATLI